MRVFAQGYLTKDWSWGDGPAWRVPALPLLLLMLVRLREEALLAELLERFVDLVARLGDLVEIMGFAFPKEWRDALVESDPEKFSLPSQSDLRYHWVHVRLAAIDANEMRDLVEDAWAFCVPKRVAEEYAGSQGYH